MALVPCPECNKQISDVSKSCPSCGFPMGEYIKVSNPPILPPPLPTHNLVKIDLLSEDKVHKKSFFNFNSVANILLTLLSLTLIGVLLYNINNSRNESISYVTPSFDNSKIQVTEKNYMHTTATKMINTYKDNEVRADSIYKDTYIEVTGIVGSIDSDLSNEAVINLVSKNDYEFNYVIASGDFDFQKKATNVNKGQIITLRCIGGGEIIGNPILNECTFK